MNEINFGFLLVGMLTTFAQVSSVPETYRGAVVEYSPVIKETDSLTTAANVKNYVQYIKAAAAKKVDIIVFPEGGLYSKEISIIPDPADRIAPYISTFQTTQTVKELSLASRDNKIYSVVNLREKRICEKEDENCPPAGYYIFNTNVAFDREGVVIARYSKYNLYDEGETSHTKDPEIVFFDTDFGVRFGTFICFDIHFPAPAQRLVQQYNIKDFVYSTFWFSELPFLTALQMQRGWAETNNVNLLASGVNLPSRGSAGSGIYNGKYGHLVQVMPENLTSKLLIADIPKFQSSSRSELRKRETVISRVTEGASNSPHFLFADPEKVREKDDPSFALLEDQMRPYASEIIEGGKKFEQTICSIRDFCCDFYVDMDVLSPRSKNYTYRAVIFNGVRKFGKLFKGGVQTCGVVLCDGPDIMNCTKRVKNIRELFKFKEIRIKGNFKSRNSFQIPSTLTDGSELLPLAADKYEFTKTAKDKDTEVSLELLWPVFDLHTFAIWGRDFTRDMEPNVPESTASTLVSLPILFVTLMAFAVFAR